MDNNTFFSEKNTDLIYSICRDDVLKKQTTILTQTRNTLKHLVKL